MNKKKVSFIIGFVVGVFADLFLRMFTGEEGNLLIHSVVFVIFFTLGFFISYVFLNFTEKKR